MDQHLRPNFNQLVLLRQLKEGNQRFAEASMLDRASELHYTRKLLAVEGQQPWAVMIGCSDSRVPIEKVFDAGLGELFVIRIAGNCIDEASLASAEFATSAWNVGLIVIVGHKNCGAVAASLDPNLKLGSPHIEGLLNRIRVAATYVSGNDQLDLSCAEKANIDYWRNYIIENSELLRQRTLNGSTLICTAYYNTFSGQVEFSDEIENFLLQDTDNFETPSSDY
jgi:carbonic anhydrase